MSNVPTNLIPTRITQLPEAPVADPAGYFPIVISGTTYKVQFSQIQGNIEVPSSRIINAGTGLTGGGTLSHDITIAVANSGIGDSQLDTTGVSAGTYGDGSNVPVVTVNTKGRVTSLSTTPVVVSGYVPTSRQVIAGTGLSGGGNLTADRTLSVNFSSASPQSLGSASAGTGVNASRDDHVHPALDLSDGTETSGVLPMGRGGTGANLSPSAGGIVYSTGSQFAIGTTGGVGQVLVSGGTGAYTWGTVAVVTSVAANAVFAGPTSGAASNASFRALVNADIPATLNGKTLESATITNVPSLTAVSANITTLTSGSATATNLTATSGTITTLVSGSATLTNLTATSGTITTLVGGSVTLTNLTVTSGTVSTLFSSLADITNLSVSSLTVSSLSLANATFTSATITTLTSTSATVSTLTSTSATITTIVGTSAAITTVSTGSLTATNLTATSGTVTTLVSSSATVTNLTATSGTITTLAGTSASITNLSLGSLVISSTTLVTNLNADSLDGQSGSYYLDLVNATGTLSGGTY